MEHLVNVDFKRPNRQLVESLSQFPTALLGDAMGRYGVMESYIKPVWPGARAAGSALTVKTFPCDNLMLHIALYHSQLGDIIVADAGGYEEGGLWGEIMTLDAMASGLAGLIVDGAVRDSPEITSMRFPVWSRAISPKGTQKSGEGSIGTPISCGGESVSPGDIIIADNDGVVVVPLEQASDLLMDVEQRQKNEAQLKRGIEAGERLFNQLNLQDLVDRKSLKFVKP